MRLVVLIPGLALLIALSSLAQPVLSTQGPEKEELQSIQPKAKKLHLKTNRKSAVIPKRASRAEDDEDEYNRVLVQEMHHSR